jgi:sarcosine oxidase
MGAGGRDDPALLGRSHPGDRHLRTLSPAGAPDVIVVGAGVVGLSAALALRDRGARVVVLESAAPGAGQSTGPGRIFRHVHDLPGLIGLAVRARLGWRAAEERLGRRLLDGRGTLMLGGPREEYAASLAAAGVPCSLVEPDDLPPGLGVRAPGLLDPGGGTIDAEACVAALAAELEPALRVTRVQAVRADGDGALAATGDGVLAAGRVLVCAGAATPALMAPLGVRIPLEGSRHVRVAAAAPAGEGLPCLLERSGALGMTGYVTMLPGGGLALGTHAGDDLPEPEAIAVTRGYIERLFPGIDATPAGLVRCESTVLAGHTEALGLYEAGPVAGFAGGNLFKHAPALGPLLAEAVLEGRADPVLAPPRVPVGEAG